MTSNTKIVRRVTRDTYGYGRNARNLVVAYEKAEIITVCEQGRRTKHTARPYDVLWWMLRCQADKTRMEKLRECKAKKAARLVKGGRQDCV